MSRFLINKHKGLKPYTPGEQPRDRRYIKLNTNESPYPPSPNAIRLAEEQLDKLMLYSDPKCTELVQLMADKMGVLPSEIIMTNGSDEVLNFAFMAYCDENTPAIFPDITYGFYKVFASINNVPFKEIPLRHDFTVDIEDYINENGTIFIANPNAPTGIVLPVSKIEQILKANRARMVIVDEAYVDFGGESCVPLIKKYDNLLVTGTFSKSRSMAGARLGFGIGASSVIEDLTSIRYSTNPYNVNRMTAAAGVGALLDEEYFKNNCNSIIETRKWCEDELRSLGFDMTASSANFIFAKHGKISGKALYQSLKDRGILVRHFDSPRIADYVRITVGSREEMQALVYNIKRIME